MTGEEAKKKIVETFGLKNELSYREFINAHYQNLPRQIKIDRADDPQDLIVYEEYVVKLLSETTEKTERENAEEEQKESAVEELKDNSDIPPMLQLVFEDANKEAKVIEEYLRGGAEIKYNNITLLKSQATGKYVGLEYYDKIIIFDKKETIPKEVYDSDIQLSKKRILHCDAEGNFSIREGELKNEE